MAFKIDWDKLGQPKTEEEKEAEYQAYLTRLKTRIEPISRKVLALHALVLESGDFSEWETKFIRDMKHKAESFGMSNVEGIALLDLTTKQKEVLNSIYEKHCGKESQDV
ncbi:uncharacterized protein NMK_2032 [Novimethylophilus kurashikiensis]|uniref:Uncharacterized protein n=1 Tax=Novimethylophilus kurashikiensis TaxID=1825523 RepID=A0A2R5FBY5_9PROT|nr:hypothetical protein [Novimethylophilus kurashikiensis]GBG14433.1 uncharacterized protein NMK_2032 [Novimethylophilus kurashikiensis]